jgi:hypothetical protein
MITDHEQYCMTQLYQLADENYGRGGDVVIECWDSPVMLEYVRENPNLADAEDLLKRLMSIWHDRQTSEW